MTTTGLATYIGPATGWQGSAALYSLEPAYASTEIEETVYWSQIVISAVDLPLGMGAETMAFGFKDGVTDFGGLACIRGAKNHHDMLAAMGYAE